MKTTTLCLNIGQVTLKYDCGVPSQFVPNDEVAAQIRGADDKNGMIGKCIASVRKYLLDEGFDMRYSTPFRVMVKIT